MIAVTLLIAAASTLVLGQDEGGLPSSLRPVSARLNNTSPSDPTGRGYLLTALGDPVQFIGKWPYEFDPPNVGISPSIDPAVVNPVVGNNPAVNGSFRVVGNTGAIAAHVIPFSDNTLLELIRPNPRLAFGSDTSDLPGEGYTLNQTANGTKVESAAIYNLTNNKYQTYHITESPLCSGHVLLPNGDALIVGGMMVGINAPYYTIGYQAVRVVDGQGKNYSLVNEMQTGRWYPSLATLPDGNIVIVGGAQIEMIGWGTSQSPFGQGTPEMGSSTSTVQCSGNGGNQPSDPSYGTATYQVLSSSDYSLSRQLALTILMESWPINTYPFLTILPTGSVLVVAGAQMEALYLDPEGATADEAIGPLPTLPYPVNFPQQGTLVLLPLQGPSYDAQVLIAGGSSAYCATAMTPGAANSFLIDVSPGANHNPVQEPTHYGRVMADGVLLPDGRVFLCNGAQTGIAGGSGFGYSAATNGATVAEIYDPAKPIGQRWSIVADSQIWRLYHSTAFLTNNATVFVAGSEVTSEHRAQEYTPDYFYLGNPRPVITSAPSSIAYNANFTIQFLGVPAIDRVVLNRLASATHGNHFDQRQIVLDFTSSGQKLEAAAPPDSNIAPPGVYQLFAAAKGFPSVAKIVTIAPETSPSTVDGNLGSGLVATSTSTVLSTAG